MGVVVAGVGGGGEPEVVEGGAAGEGREGSGEVVF